MTLRAWFDPKWTSDLQQSLVDRQLLGNWSLQRAEKVPDKRLYVLKEDLRLTDGSVLRITATCDQTSSEPHTTLAVFSGNDPLYLTTAGGCAGFSATLPTGKGGFLTLQMDFMAQVQATPAV
jgi:hypothetical protein